MSESREDDSVLRFVEALGRDDWEMAQRILDESEPDPELQKDMRAAWLLHLSVGLLPAPDSDQALQRFWARSHTFSGPQGESWWKRMLRHWRHSLRKGDEPPDTRMQR